MTFLTHIRLSATHGLPTTELEYLGQFNVFCGRNNSGKSTLLRAIADDKVRRAGICTTSTTAHQLALQHSPGTIFAGSDASNLSPIGSRLEDAYREALNSHEVWYADDQDKFNAAMEKAWKQNDSLSRYKYERGRSVNLFLQLFHPFLNQKIALLPPKRKIDTEAALNFSEPVRQDGACLTSYLFLSKNQEEGSDHKRIYNQIDSSFQEITDGFSFLIVPDTQNRLVLRFSNPRGTSADADNCGLGLQDLLVILYFSLSNDFEIILIEEPESHLHPDMQRKLLGFLRQRENKQFFVATHSNVFLDSTYTDRVFLTTYDKSIRVSDETNRAAILSELGYQITDNLVSDLVVLVEGPTDIPVLETFLLKMGILPKYQIKFWPLGGDIMDQVDISIFSERFKIFALIDQDPQSDAIRKRFVRKCKDFGIHITRLKRYAIENYFSIRALKVIFGGQVPNTITDLDPDQSLQKQIGLNVKNRSRNIAREMSLEEIQGTDLYKFLVTLGEQCQSRT